MIGQPEINIGMVGHVDHGKTTLTEALSGIWTDVHSEEIKRGISIRLGYADCIFRKCPKCSTPQCYTSKPKCPHCGAKTEVLREVSFVDSPGHETLMATMLSGAALMDGAVLVIAANETCPQPQTKEHLMALDIIGVKNIVIVQNKIDIVSKEDALKNYKEIKEFVKGTVAEDAPIIPMTAQHGTNIDILIEAIEERIPPLKKENGHSARMYIARSFDVNKPGANPEDLVGGVVGGSLKQGKIKLGDEIEIKPGIRHEEENKAFWKPITTKA
ncbi:MAG: translation initiation factor IF-2 subunit gamma, partial [Candidatus Hydrothermarchaeales archaeon]